MQRISTLALTVSVTLAAICSTAIADEIEFKNGDVLRGKVVKSDGTKLTFKSDNAGEVTVDTSAIKTLSTDEPIKLKLNDGTILNQRAQASEDDGTFTTEAGTLPEQTISLGDVSWINFSEKWTGNAFFGAILTRGNSDTESVDVRASATRRTEIDRMLVEGNYFYSRQKNPATGDKTTSADNWSVLGKYDYFFTEKLYGYASLRAERDRIALLDLRLTPSVGVGYQWFERPDFELKTEAGLAYVYEDFSTGDSNEYVAARLAYGVKKKLNDRVSVFHNLEYLPSLEDPSEFNVNADAGLRANLTKRMYSELKVEWKYDSDPAPGAVKNDTRYIVGVGVEF